MSKINFNDEKTKDFVAGLIALVFVVAAGYLALNRFNEGEGLELGMGGREPEMVAEEGTDGMVDGEVAGSSNEEMTEAQYMTYWTPNDYQQGDIEAGNYTVKEGDTLWEVAEAVYGNGNMWTKILDANSADVGYLPNGSQALIVTGQVLVVPQL